MVLVPYVLLQAIVIPLLASALSVLVGKKLGPKMGWLTGGILTYQTALLALACLDVWQGHVLIERYTWTSSPGVSLYLVADGLSAPTALIMSLICTCLAFYSIDYVRYRVEVLYGRGEAGDTGSERCYAFYYALYPFFSVGLVGLALSWDIIMIWFFMEVPIIAFYFLIDLLGYEDRHKIALLCALWFITASTLFMLGALMAYVELGDPSLSALPALVGKPLARWACALMALGLLVKAAVFGLHVWIPWVHANTPTSLAGILASYANMATYVLARTLVLPLPDILKTFSTPLMAWALLTMVYGALLTLAQDDVKRLCACSTISQISYSLLGVASLDRGAVAGGIFYMLSHCLGKAILFSTAGLIVYRTHERDIEHMGGLGRLMPKTAVLWAVGSMVLSAIPPLSGFQAEIALFSTLFSSTTGDPMKLAIAICGVLTTALTAAYTFWPLKRIFMGSSRADLKSLREASASMFIPLIVLAVASAIIGVWPGLISELLSTAS